VLFAAYKGFHRWGFTWYWCGIRVRNLSFSVVIFTSSHTCENFSAAFAVVVTDITGLWE